MKILRAILILATLVAFIALSWKMLEHKGGGTSEWVIVWSAWIGLVLNFIYLVGWRLGLPPSRVSQLVGLWLDAKGLRKFIPALVSIIIVCGIGVGAYLLNRPSRSDLSQEEADRIEELVAKLPQVQCHELVRLNDDYALSRDHKQRIIDWCDTNTGLFRIREPPPAAEMTQAQTVEMHICVGRNIIENRPPGRTIEDVFDKVSAIQLAKGMCYAKAWDDLEKARTSKSDEK